MPDGLMYKDNGRVATVLHGHRLLGQQQQQQHQEQHELEQKHCWTKRYAAPFCSHAIFKIVTFNSFHHHPHTTD
jgi:hypothetical protein